MLILYKFVFTDHAACTVRGIPALRCVQKGELPFHVPQSTGASSLRKQASSRIGVTAWKCCVDRCDRWMTTVTKVARENIATTPRSGSAHAGIMLDSCLCFSVARERNASLASYFRPTTDAAQGSEGVVCAGGVVVTVVTGAEQHMDLSQEPSKQTFTLSLDFQPSGQEKSAHVGAGVVVTVVTISLQHVDLLHSPSEQKTTPSFLPNPSGQVNVRQVSAGVVVTVVQGDTSSSQQLDCSQVLAGQGIVCFLFRHP